MPKAARVLAALKRDGWVEVRCKGSHRIMRRDDRRGVFGFHDRVDLGTIQMKQVAAEFGYTLVELREL